MNDQNDDQRLADLLLRWEDSVEAGGEVTAEELCADAPELCDRLAAKIDALKKMSWMTTSDEPARLPTNISERYAVERLLGIGGHGQVYLCRDNELDRLVAVKVSSSKFLPSLADEAKRLAKLKHDHIVSIFDVTTHDGSVAIVSEFIDGCSLAERLQSGPISTNEAVTITSIVADALHHAHTNGFVHRDVKPSNILIDQAGKAYLADFGIAQELTDGGSDESFGTLAYSSPEQVADRRQLIGPATDVYSLGVVLFECLTSKQPYDTSNRGALRDSILLKQLPGPSFVNAEIPGWLNAVCLRCLAKHPEERFKSANELATALRNPEYQPFALPVRSRSAIAFAAGVLLMAIVGWLLVDGGVVKRTSPLAEVSGNADPEYPGSMSFDGKTRIITPVERFAPCTIEAWIRPARFEDRCHFIVGSDIPSAHGIGLAVCSNVLSAEGICDPAVTISDRSIVPRKWCHVAAVFAESETRIYWQGQLVETGPATQQIGGTNFVIGNVGEQHDIDHFIGSIRAVRISKGERFKGEKFIFESEFVADDQDSKTPAVLIYDHTSPEGDRVLDRSGNNHHGVVKTSRTNST